MNESYVPTPIWWEKVKAGDLVQVDPFYGIERVVKVDTENSKESGVDIRRVELAHAVPITDWKDFTRYVVRLALEPVVCWSRSLGDPPDEGDDSEKIENERLLAQCARIEASAAP